MEPATLCVTPVLIVLCASWRNNSCRASSLIADETGVAGAGAPSRGTARGLRGGAPNDSRDIRGTTFGGLTFSGVLSLALPPAPAPTPTPISKSSGVAASITPVSL
ncbi:hypothetical protein BD310DRAFT_930396 [Dichomitus squalens]|uniref:Secreted protein n=1 Tax=Dichomitus squalens TaxID=114155 RepID=A0A4Q9PRH8_9APHY|nr:hypothetical protein BD310DRAFT_930396 [Dichomitus squalens]